MTESSPTSTPPDQSSGERAGQPAPGGSSDGPSRPELPLGDEDLDGEPWVPV